MGTDEARVEGAGLGARDEQGVDLELGQLGMCGGDL